MILGGNIKMAQIQIEEIIDYLDSDIKKALNEAINKVLPNSNVDSTKLFREFKRSISRKCSVWEYVPDQYIEKG